MSKPRKGSGDPRKAGGTIAGPGGPQDKNAVVIDTTNAVILDSTHVALMEPYRDGEAGSPIIAMTLGGRINKTTEQTEILYIFDEDGAAAVVSELLALASRIGPEFLARLMGRLNDLHDDDAIGPVR